MVSKPSLAPGGPVAFRRMPQQLCLESVSRRARALKPAMTRAHECEGVIEPDSLFLAQVRPATIEVDVVLGVIAGMRLRLVQKLYIRSDKRNPLSNSTKFGERSLHRRIATIGPLSIRLILDEEFKERWVRRKVDYASWSRAFVETGPQLVLLRSQSSSIPAAHLSITHHAKIPIAEMRSDRREVLAKHGYVNIVVCPSDRADREVDRPTASDPPRACKPPPEVPVLDVRSSNEGRL
jgi:hypothetical protein